MQARVSVLTLGVKDLDKAVKFYRDGLGWPTDGIVGEEIENGAVAFFDLQNGLKLAVWPQESLAKDARITDIAPNNPTTFSLGHNVNSKEEVDEAFAKAVQAGANPIVNPEDKSWGGYAGYFQDPDGHLWEVVWNPTLEV